MTTNIKVSSRNGLGLNSFHNCDVYAFFFLCYWRKGVGVTVLLGASFHRCLCEWLPTSIAAATLLLAMILRECTMRKQASGRWRTSNYESLVALCWKIASRVSTAV